MPDERPSAIQTHLSEVFLSATRAYKILRPVSTTFVDFTDRSVRLREAAREYELNHRISPDVYLGVSDIMEHDELAERMIVMRRLPDDRRLDNLVDSPEFPNLLRDVARLVASFHAGQPPVTGDDAGVAGAEALRRNWDDNFEVLQPMAGRVIPVEEFDRARTLVDRYLDGRAALFEQRMADGWIRDGHGDLRCEHVFCVPGGPRLIDCLAFRDDFRVADVLNDVAFLAMDLHRVAGPGAARLLVEHYDEFSNETHPSSLAHHYVAYRAAVRAKVGAIRFGQGDRAAVPEILEYHRLALQHLEVGKTRLVMVGGGAGVGKTTVALGLADRLAATCLRSDEIRKNLAGLSADQHAFNDFQQGIYDPEFSERVYDEMLREAELLLARGESVVLDASWALDHRRRAAWELGDRSSSAITELHCQAPRDVARQRIVDRMASVYNPSDASPEVADLLAATFEPWPTADAVDTSSSIARSIEAAYRLVMAESQQHQPADAVRVDDRTMTTETISFFLSRVTTSFDASVDSGPSVGS